MMINLAAASVTATARRSPEQLSFGPYGLADLVDSFYFGEEDEEEMEEEEEEDKDTDWSALEAALEESEADSVACRIRAEAERAVEAVGFEQRGDELKMRVVGWLRDRGFDAGLCSSAWERSTDGVVTVAGRHDFIDVIHLGGRRRYILEIDFTSEFAIPRPTAAYTAFLRRIPSAFAGTEVTVGRVVGVMCEAMRDSMKSAGMPLPPWRRKEYVEAKWLSEYVRRRGDRETEQGGGEGRKEEKKKARMIEGCREAEVRRGEGWRRCKLDVGQKENMVFS
ncbi:uncharacterized protein LOC121994230 [Zingiber officinale]|nr:uncharacterized protein LOC121994230 [Zingiber officinale]